MTFGSPALHARDDGIAEYLPHIPTEILQTALRVEAVLAHGSVRKMVARSMVVGRSARPNNGVEKAPMSWPIDDKTFKQRLAVALERRLHPHTNLHPKQLCYSLRVSGNTLSNWLSANNEPKGGHVMSLIRFFDSSFAEEISQGHVTKITDRRAMDAVKKLAEAQAELTAALGGKP